MTTTEELRILFKTAYDEKGARAAEGGVKGVESSVGAASAKMKAFNGVLEGASKSLAAAVGAAVVFKKAFEFGEQGSQIASIEERFEALNATIGVFADDTLARLRQATGRSVSDTELMTNASDLLNLQIAKSQDELVDLVDKVVRLKKPTESATEAIDNFTKLVANKSILRLDELGIAGDVVKTRMDELRETTRGLSDDEIFNIALKEQMAEALKRIGAESGVAVSGFQRLRVEIQNTTDEAKVFVSDGLSPILDGYFRMTDQQEATLEWFKELKEETAAGTDTYREYTAALVEAGVNSSVVYQSATRDEFERIKGLQQEAEAARQAAASVELLNRHQEEFADRKLLSYMRERNSLLVDAVDIQDEAAEVDFRRIEAQERSLNQRQTELRMVEESIARAEREAQVEADRATATEEAITARIRGQEAAERYAASQRAATSAAFLSVDVNRQLGSTLFETALQEGITATETAILAQEFTNLSDAQIRARISSAALAQKEKELGEALAAGTISIADAITELNDFKESLESGGEDVVAYAGQVDQLTGNVRATRDSLRETVSVMDELDGKTVTARVNVEQVGRVSNFDNGVQVEARSRGGPGFEGGMFLVGERGPELVSLPRGSHVNSTTTTQNFIMNLSTRETTAGVAQNFRLMEAQAGRI